MSGFGSSADAINVMLAYIITMSIILYKLPASRTCLLTPSIMNHMVSLNPVSRFTCHDELAYSIVNGDKSRAIVAAVMLSNYSALHRLSFTTPLLGIEYQDILILYPLSLPVH